MFCERERGRSQAVHTADVHVAGRGGEGSICSGELSCLSCRVRRGGVSPWHAQLEGERGQVVCEGEGGMLYCLCGSIELVRRPPVQ